MIAKFDTVIDAQKCSVLSSLVLAQILPEDAHEIDVDVDSISTDFEGGFDLCPSSIKKFSVELKRDASLDDGTFLGYRTLSVMFWLSVDESRVEF